MAEKLIIKNFGPIKDAEIDLNRILILIGPQSTGKSTIAKLITIFRDFDFITEEKNFEQFLKSFQILSYLKSETLIDYRSQNFSFFYSQDSNKLVINKDYNELEKLIKTSSVFDINNSHIFTLGKKSFKSTLELIRITEQLKILLGEESKYDKDDYSFKEQLENGEKYRKQVLDELSRFINYSTYLPAERQLISMISSSIMNLITNDIPIPKLLTEFGATFEKARNKFKSHKIDFLEMSYQFKDGEDRIYTNEEEYVLLSEASSGLQTLVPLLLVIQYTCEEVKKGHTFVIEEPELNLYPQAQYELSKIIADSCTGQHENGTSNELIITTHSPYILAAFNNFLLAHKIGEQQEETDPIESVVPKKSWVSPEDFNAYYVDGKQAIQIFDQETGLIAENRLDDASEEIMGDFDEMMNAFVPQL